MADEGTTVGVDVDTKAAQKSVNDLTRAFNALLGAMTQLNNASSAFTKLQQQMSGAAGAATNANLNFNNLVNAINRVNGAIGGLSAVTSRLTGLTRGASTATAQMNGLAVQAQNVGQAFTTGFSSAQAAVVSLNQGIGILRTIGSGIAYVGTAFVEMGGSITKTLSQLQGFLSIMTVTTGSAKDSGEQFEFIRNTANKFGIEVTALTENYAKLRASMEGSANATENSQKLFTAMAMASRSLHSSSQDTKLAFYAVTQMASKGVISMEELRRQLGEKWPGTMEMAARATGRTAASLEEDIRKGTVDSIKFLNAFSDEVIRTYSASSLVAANSVDAAMARLKNLWIDYVNVLLNSGTANEIAAMFDAIRERLADPQLMAYFNAMVSSVTNRIREFVSSLTAEDLRNAFDSVKRLIDGITGAIKSLAEGFKWIIDNSSMIAKAFTIIAGAFAGMKVGAALGGLTGGAVLPGVGAIPGALAGGVIGLAAGAGTATAGVVGYDMYNQMTGFGNRGLGMETTNSPGISLATEIAQKAEIQAKQIADSREAIRKIFASTIQHNLQINPDDPRVAGLFKDYNLSMTTFSNIFGELLGRDGKKSKFDAIKDPAKKLKAQQEALFAAANTGFVIGPRPDSPIDLTKPGEGEKEANMIKNIIDRLKQYRNNVDESLSQLQGGFNIKSKSMDIENLIAENSEILGRQNIPAIKKLLDGIRESAKAYDDLNIKIKRSEEYFKQVAEREKEILDLDNKINDTYKNRLEFQRTLSIEQLQFAVDKMPDFNKDKVFMEGFDIVERKRLAIAKITEDIVREQQKPNADKKAIATLERELTLMSDLYDQTLKLAEARFMYMNSIKYDPFEGMKKGLESYASMTLAYGEQMKTAMTSAFSSMEDAFTRFVTTGKFSLRDLVNTIIGEFARVAIRTSITGPMSQGLSNVLGTMFGPYTGTAGHSLMAGMNSASIAAVMMHNGGTVGMHGRGRTVPAGLFNGARRYHSGGEVLGPNEVPIIAEKGETIYSKNSSKQGSGGVTVVQHINVQGGANAHDVMRAGITAKQAAIDAMIDAQRRGKRRP
jgi:lambda family phage tail tape measure protein